MAALEQSRRARDGPLSTRSGSGSTATAPIRFNAWSGVTGTTGQVPGFGTLLTGFTITAANTLNNTGGVSTSGGTVTALVVGHNAPVEVVGGTDLSAVTVTAFFIGTK
jgi:hypothetical protein